MCAEDTNNYVSCPFCKEPVDLIEEFTRDEEGTVMTNWGCEACNIMVSVYNFDE